MNTLEQKIREKAGLISEAMLVGPDKEEGPDLEIVEAAEEKPKVDKKAKK